MTLADIRPGLRTLLLSNSDIATMIGARIYPIILPQGVRENSIVYNRVSDIESYHFTGPSGLIVTRMQIDAWSPTIDGASALADLIKDCVSGFKGQLAYGTSSPTDYVNVQGIFMLHGDEDYDAQADLFRRRRDYNIVYGDRNA